MNEDYTDIFESRMKSFRPWAVYFIVWLLGILGLPVLIFLAEMDIISITIYIIAMAAAIIPFIKQYLYVSKCPRCKRFMGRDIGKFCPLCGVRIRKGPVN